MLPDSFVPLRALPTRGRIFPRRSGGDAKGEKEGGRKISHALEEISAVESAQASAQRNGSARARVCVCVRGDGCGGSSARALQGLSCCFDVFSFFFLLVFRWRASALRVCVCERERE